MWPTDEQQALTALSRAPGAWTGQAVAARGCAAPAGVVVGAWVGTPGRAVWPWPRGLGCGGSSGCNFHVTCMGTSVPAFYHPRGKTEPHCKPPR